METRENMEALPQHVTGADAIGGLNLDSEKFPDAMGWRAKFGVLTPAPNTIVENEFHEMAPLGVINIINRYYVPNQKVRGDDDWRLIMAHTRSNVANASDRPRVATARKCSPS